MGFHPHWHGFEEGPTERKTSTKVLLLRLIKYLLPYRKLLLIAVLTTIISSVADVIGPYLLGLQIIGRYILASDYSGLQLMVLAYILVLLISWASDSIRTFSIGKIGESMLFKLRSDLFAHLQKLSFSFFDKADSGDTISIMTNDTDSIGQAFTSGVVMVLSDVLSLALTLIVMFTINVQLTLVSMLVVPLLIGVALAFSSRFRSTYRATRKTISGVTSKLQEGISGIREIKSFTREAETIKDFTKVNQQEFQANLQANIIWGAFFPTVQLIQAIGTSIVIIYGGMLAFSGSLGTSATAIGILITFTLYVGRFFGPIFDLTNFYNTIQSALAAAERIFNFIDRQPEIKDVEDATQIPTIKGEIEFKDVTFAYVQDHPVLYNVSFRIRPKETVALVGSTGAGKSTIIKLISRFYETKSGSVTIDGQDVKQITQESMRKQMGIVLQESFLFMGTIMENIRYGNLEASDEDIMNAAKTVGAHEFISKTTNGYKTEIGERGAGLSVGQKQLISFARAFLRNPAIMVLDEATSSIDPYTDLLIRKAMKVLLKDRTSIIIAHRLSTVRNADRIFVVDNGRIVEEGNHKQLMKKKGIYRHLYEMQFKEPEVEKAEITHAVPKIPFRGFP
jgi:ATP-binding cassette subfamily B multidrug efflux pump